MRLFTTQFIRSSPPLETNIPLTTLTVVKFRIATGHQITLEMNVLKTRSVRGETLHLLQGKEKLTEMKVTKQCPLVLLVNVSCRQVGTLEIEVVEVMGCGMSWVRSRRNMLGSNRTWGLRCRF